MLYHEASGESLPVFQRMMLSSSVGGVSSAVAPSLGALVGAVGLGIGLRVVSWNGGSPSILPLVARAFSLALALAMRTCLAAFKTWRVWAAISARTASTGWPLCWRR